ncbi:MAG: hypothetical protein E7231_09560 [Cellulosilyticum sp.]|nr:hypothetical protein [Cellulosilyticum sp.]
MSNKKLFKWGIAIGVVILIGLSLGTIGCMYTKINAFSEVFAKNVYIEDLAVGGLTKAEAKAKLEQSISDEMSKQHIVFTNGDVSKEIPLYDLGITYNIDETIDSAFKVGHEENFFKKYQIAKNGMEESQHFNLVRSIDETKIDQQLEACSDVFYTAPVNATLKRVNRKFVTTKEVNGASLNQAATKEKLLTSLEQMEDDTEKITIEVVTETILPECTEASLADVQTLVSSFSTSYNNSDANRNENLKVAANKISRMLLPDEVFYLSNQLEPFTEAAGYKNAGTIVNGKIEDSLGGGICQVGSTLYNAVLLTDLEIVYRQNHSLAVSYVPLGRDATYNTGTIDFKFKNNSGHPIFIEGYCENNEVIVNIYGHKSLKSEQTIKFESVVTEVIPAPETKYEDDPTLEEGKEVVEVRALDGKRVTLYKLYYEGNQLVNKELVNKSYYKPRAAVIRRGTKKTDNEVQASTSPSTTPNESISQNIPSGTVTPTPIPSVTPDTSESTDQIEQENIADNNFFVTQE